MKSAMMTSESTSAGSSMTSKFLLGIFIAFLAPFVATVSLRIKPMLGLFITCLLSFTGALISAIGAWDLLTAFIAAKVPTSPSSLAHVAMILLPSCATYCFSLKQRARSFWNLATRALLGEDSDEGKGTIDTTEGPLISYRNPRPGRTRKKRSRCRKTEDVEEIHRTFPPPTTRAEWQYSAEPSNPQSTSDRAKAALIVRIWKLSIRLGLEKNKVAGLIGKVETLESDNASISTQLVTTTKQIDWNKNEITQVRNSVYRTVSAALPHNPKTIVKDNESDLEYIVRAVSDLGIDYKEVQESLETPSNTRLQNRFEYENARRVEAEKELASLIKTKDAEDKCKSLLIKEIKEKDEQLETEKKSHADTMQLLEDKKTEFCELDRTKLKISASLTVAVHARDEALTKLSQEKIDHDNAKRLHIQEARNIRRLNENMAKKTNQLLVWQNNYRELEKSHKSVQEKLEESKAAKEKAEAKADVFSKAHQKSSRKAANSQALLTSSIENVEHLTGLLETNEAEIAAGEKREEKLAKDLEAHKKEALETGSLRAQLTTANGKVQDLEAEKAASQEKIADFQVRESTANKRIEELKDDHAASQEKIATFQARESTANKTIQELKDDHAASQERILNIQAQEETANNKVRELKGDNAACHEEIRELKVQLAQAKLAHAGCNPETSENLCTSTASRNPDLQDAGPAADPTGSCISPSPTETERVSTAENPDSDAEDDRAIEPTVKEFTAETSPAAPVADSIPATSAPLFVQKEFDDSADGKFGAVSPDDMSEGVYSSFEPSTDKPSATEESQSARENHTDDVDNQDNNGLIEAGSPEFATEIPVGCADDDKNKSLVKDVHFQSAVIAEDGDLEDPAKIGPIEHESQSATETQAGAPQVQDDAGLVDDGESYLVKDAQDGDQAETGSVDHSEPVSAKAIQAGDSKVQDDIDLVENDESHPAKNAQDDDFEAQDNIGPVDDDKSQSVKDLQGDNLQDQANIIPVEESDSRLSTNVQDEDLAARGTKTVEACESQAAIDAADEDLEMQEETSSADRDEPQSVEDAQDGSLKFHGNISPMEASEPYQAENIQAAGAINSAKGSPIGSGPFESDYPIGSSDSNETTREAADCRSPEQASQGDESGSEEQEDLDEFEDCLIDGKPIIVQGDSSDKPSMPIDSGTSHHGSQPTQNANLGSQTPAIEASSGADADPQKTELEDPARLPEADGDKSVSESGASEAHLSDNERTQHSEGPDTSLESNTTFDDIKFDDCNLFGEPLDSNAMDGVDYSDPTPSMDAAPQSYQENQVIDGNMPNPTSSTASTPQTHYRDPVMDGAGVSNTTPSPSPIAQVQDEDQVMGGTDLPDDNPPSTTNQVSQDGDQIMEDVGGANTTIVPPNGFGSSSQNTQGISPASSIPVIQGSSACPNGSGIPFGQSSVVRKPVVTSNYAQPTVIDESEDHIMGDSNDPPAVAQSSGDIEDQEMDEADELDAAIKSFELPSAGGQNFGFTNNQSAAAMPSQTHGINTLNRGSDFQQSLTNATSQALNLPSTPSSTYVNGNNTASPQFGGAPAYQNTASSTSTDQTSGFNPFNGINSSESASFSFQNPVPQMPTSSSSSSPPQQNSTADSIQPIFNLNTDQVQEDTGLASRRRANRENANRREQSSPAVPSNSINQWGWADRTPDTPEEIAERAAMAAEMEAEFNAHAAAEEEEKQKKLFAEMEAARGLDESPPAAAERGPAELRTAKKPQAQRMTSGGPVEPRVRARNNHTSNALRKMAARNAASGKAANPIGVPTSNEQRGDINGSSGTHTSATVSGPTASRRATAPTLDNLNDGPGSRRPRNVANAEHPPGPATEQGSSNDEVPARDDPPVDDQAKGHKRKNVAKAATHPDVDADQTLKKSKSFQEDVPDPKLKGSVKYKEVGCAIPLIYKFGRMELDRVVVEAQEFAKGLRAIPVTDFEKAVEIVRFDDLYLMENIKNNEPPVDDAERLNILRYYRPEYKRDREMYWDTVLTIARDFNAADMRNLVSQARVQATIRKNSAGFKEPMTEIDFRMAALKWKRDPRYSKAKKTAVN